MSRAAPSRRTKSAPTIVHTGPFERPRQNHMMSQFLSRRTFRTSALFSLLVLLGACQDPSGVGLELIGEEATEPTAMVLAANSVEVVTQDDFSGGFATGASPVQSRVMVGAVTDPLLGDAVVDAYLDFVPPQEVPDGFFDRTVTAVSIRLSRTYAHGDSTGMLPITVFELNDDWSPVGAVADTSFAADTELMSYSVPAEDEVYSLALPSSWVSENAELLQSDSVATALDGFKISVTEGMPANFVAGFNATESSVRVFTAQDTVDYPLAEIFSSIMRDDAPPPPANIALVRDGASEVTRLTFDFSPHENQALANATIRLNIDPSVVETPGFERGTLERLALFGQTETGNPVFIEASDVDENGTTVSFSSATLTATIQAALLGNEIFDFYQIGALESQSTLDVLPVIIGPEPMMGETDLRPRLSLTLVPAPS